MTTRPAPCRKRSWPTRVLIRLPSGRGTGRLTTRRYEVCSPSLTVDALNTVPPSCSTLGSRAVVKFCRLEGKPPGTTWTLTSLEIPPANAEPRSLAWNLVVGSDAAGASALIAAARRGSRFDSWVCCAASPFVVREDDPTLWILHRDARSRDPNGRDGGPFGRRHVCRRRGRHRHGAHPSGDGRRAEQGQDTDHVHERQPSERPLRLGSVQGQSARFVEALRRRGAIRLVS